MCCLGFFVLSQLHTADAAEAAQNDAPYTLNAAFYRMAGHAGDPAFDLLLALTFTPRPGYYTYASSSQAAGKPTTVTVANAQGLAATPFVLYPKGLEREDPFLGGQRTRVYPGPVTVAVPLQSARSEGQSLTVRYSGLLCSAANCTPFDLTLRLTAPSADALPALQEAKRQAWWPAVQSGVQEPNNVSPAAATPGSGRDGAESAKPSVSLKDLRGGASPPAEPADAPRRLRPSYFAPSLEVASLSKALLLGFFAGLLLNIMPCVLPVLGLKLASLLSGTGTESAASRRRAFQRHQVFFSLGIMAWFVALAALLASLELVWGQIFQSMGLILGLSMLLLLLACNLFGVFSLPILDIRGGPSKNPDFSAFMNGVTATLLATPCSGPLLGGVLSWALLQPLPSLVMALLSVGIGMSSPYILLAARPDLSRYMPRPGPWMRVLEQLLGFLLLAAAAYLVTLLPVERLPKVLGALVLTGFAAWLWGQAGGVRAGKVQRILSRCLAAALIIIACTWPLSTPSVHFAWENFDEKTFQASLGEKPLLVEFTADWCPTCKVMEATTLTPSRMAGWQKQHGFTAIRVDLTQDNPAGQALLRHLGSSSIPLLAFFPAGPGADAPLVLRDVATPGQMKKALEQAFAKNGARAETLTPSKIAQ